MYFRKRIYVWSDNKGSLTITGLKSKVNPERVTYIIEEAGYWRKANAIHKWFVDHVQNGNDDCKAYYVSKEKMQELLETVNKVLEASKIIDGDVHNGATYAKGKAVKIIEKGKVIKDPFVAQVLLQKRKAFSSGVLTTISITIKIWWIPKKSWKMP